jgi:hypothetical protein
MESFFKTLKVERVHRLQYASRSQAKLDIVNWIEGFYNSTRLHSPIDYRSPADFERSLLAVWLCCMGNRYRVTVSSPWAKNDIPSVKATSSRFPVTYRMDTGTSESQSPGFSG